MRKSAIATAFGAVAAATVAFGAVAFACTNLATLNISSSSGKPGDVVKVTGTSFGRSTEKTPLNPVVLHWNAVDGPVLATVEADSAGNIAADVTIPQAPAGSYVIVATQTKQVVEQPAGMTGHNPRADNVFGTPARVAFTITGAGADTATSPVGATSVTVPGDSSPVGLLALTVGLGVAGLALFGAGFAAVVRQVRRREVPAAVRRD